MYVSESGKIYLSKPGAPPGGRVHWLLMCLPSIVNKLYEFSYDEEANHLCLTRYYKRKLVEVFVCMRTSVARYVVMYHNFEVGTFEKKSFAKAQELANYIERTARCNIKY